MKNITRSTGALQIKATNIQKEYGFLQAGVHALPHMDIFPKAHKGTNTGERNKLQRKNNIG